MVKEKLQKIYSQTEKYFTYIEPFTVSIDLVRFMVINATFNNISVISWQSVLFVDETRVPEENHRLCCKSLTNFIT
jgi:hypothetical protein